MALTDNQTLSQEIAEEVMNQLDDGNLVLLHYRYKTKGDGRNSLIDWMIDEFGIGDRVDAEIKGLIAKGLNGNGSV